MATGDPNRFELTRRRFLQAALATGSVAALDARWMRDAAGAPLGPDDRILVIVELNGGNDGLNTFVPFETGAYYDIRRASGLAIGAQSVQPVGGGAGLNPALAFVKTMFDSGKVKILRGIGHPDNDLSHFSCMAKLMGGLPANLPPTSGWIGRYLDTFGADPIRAVSIGDGTVPLLLVGARRRAAGLPSAASGLFGSDRTNEWDAMAFDTISGFASGSSGMPWTDLAAASGRDAITTATALQPAYDLPPSNQRQLVRDLIIAAKLINLDLGVRVLHVRLSGFDAHSEQARSHDGLLAHVDAAIAYFFATLDPRFADRVILSTLSEFGRRVRPNGSNGTDHGTASVAFVIGDRVRGGLDGAQPSLTSLDSRGDLRVELDSRSLFATLLAQWLRVDEREILGASYPLLDLFAVTPAAVAPAPAPLAPTSASFIPIGPTRLLDTRTGNGAPRRPLEGGEMLDLVVAGRAGVPPGALGAVAINVTATRPTAVGYLTVFPTGATRPTSSNVNFETGQTVPNLVVVKLGDGGRVSIYNSTGLTDVLADLVGWLPPEGGYHPLVPARVMDTRLGSGPGSGRLAPLSTLRLPVLGRGGVASEGVDAVVLNVTAVDPNATTYLSVWPTDRPRPNTSNLNIAKGDTAANLVIAPVGTDGAVNVYNHGGSPHLIADVMGWFPVGGSYHPTDSTRVLDTRSSGRVGPGRVVTIDGWRAAVVPQQARGLAVNVTAVDSDTGGFVTVYPNGTPRPEASHLNFGPGSIVANLALVGLGGNGKVDLFNAAGSVHLVADVVGWFE